MLAGPDSIRDQLLVRGVLKVSSKTRADSESLLGRITFLGELD
jgi:hypothetical protein